MYTMRIAESIMYWAEKKKMKIIIVTNNEGVAKMFQKVVDAKVFICPGFSEDEFVKVLNWYEKHSERTLKEIWNFVGDDLEYAKEILDSGLGVEKFLQRRKEEILQKVKKEEGVEGLIEAALRNVVEEYRLGNVFKGSKLARFLIEAQVGRAYIGTVEFRNKFVLKVFLVNLGKGGN